jgi:hypothetical protein
MLDELGYLSISPYFDFVCDVGGATLFFKNNMILKKRGRKRQSTVAFVAPVQIQAAFLRAGRQNVLTIHRLAAWKQTMAHAS